MDDVAARIDIEEMLDTDFKGASEEPKKRKRKAGEGESHDPEEEKQVLFQTPYRKFAKRRIAVVQVIKNKKLMESKIGTILLYFLNRNLMLVLMENPAENS